MNFSQRSPLASVARALRRGLGALKHPLYIALATTVVLPSLIITDTFGASPASATEVTGQGGEIVATGTAGGRAGVTVAVGSDGKFYVPTNGGVTRFTSAGVQEAQNWSGWFGSSDGGITAGGGFIFLGYPSGSGIGRLTEGTGTFIRFNYSSGSAEVNALAYAPIAGKLFSAQGTTLRRFDSTSEGKNHDAQVNVGGTAIELRIQNIAGTEYVVAAGDFGIKRFLATTGAEDTAFSAIAGNFTALAIDPADGSILAGTTTNVFRYPAGGGTGSAALLATNRSIRSLAVDSKGNFLAATTTGLYRYSSAGVADAVFNANANTATLLNVTGVAIASNGRIGAASTSTSASFRAHRGSSAAPDAPTISSTTASDRSVNVTVARSGTKIVSRFRVTAVEEPSKFCEIPGTTPAVGLTSTTGGSCAVTGLTNGNNYTFVATAINVDEASAASAASAAVSPIDNVGPVFQSASVDAAGTTLTMTYSEALGPTTAPPSAFVVKNGSATISVSSVTVSGSTLVLSLASPIGAGLTASVAYTAPTASLATDNAAVQDLIGNDAATLSTSTIPAGSNLSQVDQTAPIYIVNSATADSTGMVISLTFGEALAGTAPNASSFTVANTSGIPVSVSSVEIDGTTLRLNLASPVGAGKVVTVSYVAPTPDSGTGNAALQDAIGNDSASLTSVAVTNSSTVDQTGPVRQASSSVSSSGLTLTLVYNEALHGTAPGPELFTVTNAGAVIAVTNVVIDGSTAVLTLATPTGIGKTVNVAYSAPVNDFTTTTAAIQDTIGNDALSFSATSVTNNSTVDQNAPTWSSAVANAAGTTITITLNEALSATTAPPEAFTVTNTGTPAYPVTVTGATVSGNTVVLTLSGAVGSGRSVTVTYTAPTSVGTPDNLAVQDVAGNDLATQTNRPVTNNSTADQTSPTWSSAVTNAAGTTITITLNEALSATTALPEAFTVANTGTPAYPVTVTGATVTGNTVVLTLSGAVGSGRSVTVSYTAPTSIGTPDNSAVQDVAGNDLAAQTNRPVTNNSTADQTAPTLSRTDVSSDGTTVVLTYNGALNSTSIADVSAFVVSANSVVMPITSVSVTGSTVVLLMATALERQDLVRVSYSPPVSDNSSSNAATQDAAGNDAAAITLQTVTANNSTVDTRGPNLLTTPRPTVSTNGLALTLTFDEAVSATTAPLAAYTVLVDGAPFTPSSLEVSGSTVILRFTNIIGSGRAVTVAYEAPASNNATSDLALQDAAGNNGPGFAATTATNSSTVDLTAPILNTAVVPALGTSVVLTFNETIASTTAPASAYTVTVDGSPVTITSATRGTTTITLALPVAITGGQVVTVSYNAPTPSALATNNAVQDSAGNDAASISNLTVTNSSTQGRPVLTSVVVGTAGTNITLNYNKSGTTHPLFSQFTWYLNGELIPITWGGGSNSSNTFITYSPTSPVITSRDVVTYTYTEPNTGTTTVKSVPNGSATNSSTVVDTTPPAISSATLAADGKTLTLAFNETLGASTVGASAFSVRADGVSYVVSSRVLSGSSIVLTLGSTIPGGAVVEVDYAAPATQNLLRLNLAVQDGAGNDAVAFTAQPVTNNSTQVPDIIGPRPTQVTYTGNTVTVTFDETIASTVPPVSAFTVYAGMNEAVVQSVAVASANTLVITLATSIDPDTEVSVAYTQPTPDASLTNSAIQDGRGNDANTFSTSTTSSNGEWSWTGGTFAANAICASQSPRPTEMGSDAFRQRTLPNGITYSVGVSGASQCVGDYTESLSDRGGQDSMFASIGMVTDPGVYMENINPINGECGVKQPSMVEYCARPDQFITIRFDRPVENPVFSFAGWGSSASGTQSWTELQIVTPGVTLTQLPGTTPTSIVLENNGTYLKPGTTTPGTRCTNNAGCGSFLVNGTVTEVKFSIVFAANGSNWGNTDAWNMIASVTEDFGFAPSSYEQNSTTSHVIGTLRLGQNLTADNLDTLYATTNDDSVAPGAAIPPGEDGVVSWPDLGEAGDPYSVDVSLAGLQRAANLCGWVDFNISGTFDVGERACSANIPVGATSATLNWTIPADVTEGTSYSRLRLSYSPVLFPTGKTTSGEVEDYRMLLEPGARPRAVDDVSSGPLDANQTISVLTNDLVDPGFALDPETLFLCDPDPDNNPATQDGQEPLACDATSLVVPGEGTYTVNSDGTVTLNPLPDFVGVATPVTYQVSDVDDPAKSTSATVTATVTDPPSAIDDTPAAGPSDIAQNISVLANDTESTNSGAEFDPTTIELCDPDPDNDPLTSDGQTPPNCSLTTVTTDDGTYAVSGSTPGVVVFTPAPGFYGTVTQPVTYQVADTDDLVVSAVITPSVVRPPTADDVETSGPYGVAQTATVLGGSVSFTVSFTGTPISASTLRLLDPATSTYVTSPVVISGEGTYSIVNGEIRFTPETGFYGEATPVRYRVADSLGQTATALYTPTIAPPPPLAVDDSSSGFINQPQSANALADDESYTGTPLDPSLLHLCVAGVCGTSPVVVAGEGTYSIVDGDIVFTPVNGFVGAATPVTYKVTDSNGLTDTAIYSPTVVPPPLAVDDTPAPGPNDVPQIINVLSNDLESSVTESPFVPSTVKLCNPSTAPPETAPNCSATIVTIDGEGTYSVNPDGTVTFDPIDGFSGLVTVPVRYQVEDAQGQVTSALISPSVTMPPTADNETTSGAYGAVQTSDVLDGDVSFTGVPLDAATLRLFDPQANGGLGAFVTTPVVIEGEGTYEIVNGVVQFTPAQGFTGEATPVTYRVSDSDGRSVTATYTPDVGDPAPPVAVDDTSTGDFGVEQVHEVLENDVSNTGATLPADQVRLIDPVSGLPVLSVTTDDGTFTVNEDGTITFAPAVGFVGEAAPVTYRITDSFSQIATATYTPTVNPPSGPVAGNDTSSGPLNTPQVEDVMENDTSAAGTTLDPTELALIDPVSGVPVASVTTDDGTFAANSDGTITFTPATGFTGVAEPVTYQITDSLGQTDTATYTPTVIAPPVATDDTSTGAYGATQTEDVMTDDSSNTGVVLQRSLLSLIDPVTSQPVTSVTTVDGTFTANSDGTITFVPAPGFAGVADPVTYQITDSLGQTDTATYTPTVDMPAGPVAVDDASTGDYGVPQTEDVLDDDTSNTGTPLDGSLLRLIDPVTLQPVLSVTTADGTFTANSDGTITFTPSEGFSGVADPVTYQVTDSLGQTATALYTPTVADPPPPLSPPVAVDDVPAPGAQDVTQRVDVLANDVVSPDTGAAFDPDSLVLCAVGEVAPDCSAVSVTTVDGVYTVVEGVLEFVPAPGFTGVVTVPVDYQVSDVDGQVASATVTLSVIAEPVATDDTSTGAYGAPQTEDVVADDASNTGTPLDESLLRLIDPVSGLPVTSVTTEDGTFTANSDGTITFVPAPGFAGVADPVTYQVTDSLGQTDTATYTPTVNMPDGPVAVDDTSTGPFNTPQTEDVLDDDTSNTGTPLAGSQLRLIDPVTSQPVTSVTTADGTFTANNDGTITFTPADGFSGVAAPVTYQVTDSLGQTDTATYTPTVIAPPVATDDTSSGAYGASQTEDVMTDDSSNTGVVLQRSLQRLIDPDSGLPVTSVTTEDGTFTANGDGTITFEPAPGFAGEADPVTYQITDSLGQTDTATYTPTVTMPDGPVAVDDTSTGPFDTPQTEDVLDDDSSNTGTPLAGSQLRLIDPVTSQPVTSVTTADGTFTANSDGTITFTPAPGFAGEAASVTYQVTDSLGQTDTATYTPMVNLPDGPVAVDDTSTGPFNTPQTEDVLDDDSSNTGTPLSGSQLRLIDPDSGLPVTSVTTADGTFTANSDGTITFTPASGFAGEATPVTYQVTDSLGQTDTATYTPTVTPPDGPVAVDDTSTGPFDTPQTEDVLDDDSSNTGTPLAGSQLRLIDPVTSQPVTSVTTENGTFTANSDGTITFTPAPGFAGEATPVTYQVTDSLGQTDTATYTPTVNLPDGPVAVNDTSTGAYGATQTEDVLDDDSSNTGTPLSGSQLRLIDPDSGLPVTSVTTTDGTFTANSDGTITFEPAPGFAGVADPVTYQVTDSLGQTDTATYTPTVTPPSGPVAVDDTSTGPFNTPQTEDVMADDSSNTGTALDESQLRLIDPDSGLPVTSVTTADGTFTANSDGTITFDPTPGFTGVADPVTYQVTDSLGQTDTATYTPTVTLPDGPIAVDDTSTGLFNAPQTEDVLDDDSSNTGTPLAGSQLRLIDPDSGLPVTSVTTADGTFTANSDGTITFEPAPGFTGVADPITYQVTDSLGQADTATYTPTVLAPPVAVDDVPAPGAQGVTQRVDVLANDEVSPDTESAFDTDSLVLCAFGEVAPDCSAVSVTTVDGVYTVVDGVLEFVPAPGFAGVVTVPVEYQVADVDGQVASATVTLSVIAPPFATDDTSSGAYGATQTEDVMADDESNTGTPLDESLLRLIDPVSGLPVTSVTTEDGTFTANSDGTITFVPAPGFAGVADPVTYQITDSLGQTDTATYTPTVNPPDGPVAVDDTSTGPFNTPQTEDVMADDSSNTGTPLSDSLLRLIDPVTSQPVTSVTTRDGTFTANSDGTITFVPAPGFVGEATPVTYQVTDSLGQTDTATYTPTVTLPDGPAATDDTSTGAYGATQTEDVLDDDSSNTGTPLSDSLLRLIDPVTSQPVTSVTTEDGTFTANSDGTITFVPAPGFAGVADPVTYQVTDSLGQTDTATYTPTVNLPDGPVAVDDTSIGPFNTPQTEDVLDDDSSNTGTPLAGSQLRLIDPDSGLSVTSVTTEDGTFTANSDGTITFTPAPGFAGEATPVTYQVTDSLGQTDTATYTPTVSMPDGPVAVDDTSTGAYGSPQTEDVLADDSSNTGTPLAGSQLRLIDPDSGLPVTSVTTEDGTFTANSDGTITFEPAPGFAGVADPVTYQVTDSLGQTDTATYTPTVTPPSGPVAVDDTSTGPFNAPQTEDVMADDSSNTGTALDESLLRLIDPDSGLPATSVTTADGTFTANSDGTITFTPADGFSGVADPVTYQITDSLGQTDTATYTPTVIAPPLATDDTSTGAYGATQTEDVMTDDSSNTGVVLQRSLLRLIDPDSGLPVTSVTTEDGTFTANSDGTITFEPAPGFAGVADPVTYQVTDSLGQTDTATYTPTVTPPSGPVAVDDTSTGPFNTPQTEDVMADDSSNTGTPLDESLLRLIDPDSGLPVTSVTTEDGAFTANSDGTITFTPADGFVGVADPVTYQVTDSLGQSDTATYTPTVTLPDGPVAVDDTSTGEFGETQTEDVMADDSSNTGTPLDESLLRLIDPASGLPVTSVTTEDGTFTANSDGTITFEPAPGFAGVADPVTYQITDSLGQTDTATYTPTVNMPDGPVAVDDTSTGPFNTPQTEDVMADDSSNTGTPLSDSLLRLIDPVTSQPVTSVTTEDGTFTANSDGTITFTPAPGFVGEAAPVTYQITDSLGQTDTATYTPTVNMPDGPAATDDTSTGAYGATQIEDVMADDSSNTGTPLSDSLLRLIDPVTSQPVTSVTTEDGTFTANSDGTITFEPAPGFAGVADPVTYQVTDSLGQTDTATYTPTVTPPSGPVAVDDTSTGPFNTPQTEDVMADDSSNTGTALDESLLRLIDPDSGLPVTSVTTEDGTFTANSDGTITFTPADGFVGVADPVTYQVTDSLGQTDTATYTPTVIAPPVAVDDTSTGAYGATQIENVMTDDSSNTGVVLQRSLLRLIDPDSGLPVTTVTTEDGTFTANTDGTITFVPAPGFAGVADPVTYQITDSLGQTDTATYTPTVNMPAPPVAVNDTSTGPFDTPQTEDVLDDDSSNTGTPLAGSLVRLIDPVTSQPVTSVTTADGTFTANNDGTITFTPADGFSGVADPVTYQVTDSLGQTDTATYTPTVIAPPVAVDDTSTGAYGATQIENVMTDDSSNTGVTLQRSLLRLIDPDTGLPVTSVTTEDGTFTANSDGTITFVPAPGFAGVADPVTYQITDSLGQTDTATYTPTVTPPDGPVAVDDTSTGPFNTPQTEDVMADDSSNTGTALDESLLRLIDPDSGSPVTSVTTEDGTFTANSDGTITFDPTPGFTGVADPVTYQVTDSLGQTDTATYTPTVIAPPVAIYDTSTGPFNTPQTENVMADDSSNTGVVLQRSLLRLIDPDSGLPVTSVTTEDGTFTANSNGTITFVPAPGFAGVADPVTYQITDSLGQTDTATYTPTVTPPDGPVAVDDTSTGPFNTPQTEDVMADDSSNTGTALDESLLRLIDPDSGSPVTSVTTEDGTFTANSDGTITFTPADGFSGVADPVTYQVTDSLGQTDTATYTPTVIAPPVAVDDTSSGAYGATQIENVMTDDSSNTGVVLQRSLLRLIDPDSGLPVTSVTTEDGTFTANSDGTITFVPAPGFAGVADPVTYQITDSLGQTDTATYTPSVLMPAPPVAANDTSTGPFNTPQTEDVMADDSSNTGTLLDESLLRLIDPDSGLPVTSVTTEDGTFTANSDGTITFTPADGFVGEADPVTYQVTDSLGQTDTATYTPTVIAPPVAVDDTSSGAYGATQIENVMTDDYSNTGVVLQRPLLRLIDPDSGEPVLTVTTEDGTFTANTDGTITFVPAPGFAGEADPVTYQITDSLGQTDTATYTPTVTPPDGPVAVDDTSTGPFNTPQTEDVMADDSSNTGTALDESLLRLIDPVSGEPVTSVTTADGTFTANSDGTITFDPTPGFTGIADPVTYQVTDSLGQTDTATYTPTVIAPPVAVDDASTGLFNTPQTENVMADDSSNTGVTLQRSLLRLIDPDSGLPVTTVTTEDGTFTANTDGTITFVPTTGFSGEAAPVTYRITDSLGQTDTATYTPTVIAPPVAVDDTSTGPYRTPQTEDVMADDSSNTGVALQRSLLRLIHPTTGLPVLTVTTPDGVYTANSNGTITFAPVIGFAGEADPVEYRVTDSLGQTATATYTPTVLMPDPPVAVDDTSTGAFGATQIENVMTDDSSNTGVTLQRSLLRLIDPESGLPVTTVTTEDGTFTANSNGTITFVPAPGFAGVADPVTYQVTDSLGQTDTATYTPTVLMPAPPVAVNDTSTGPFNTPQTEDVMADDSSNTGTPLDESLLRLIDPVTSQPVTSVTTEDGTFTANSDGTITFVPADGFSGVADPVTYQVTDSLGQTDTATYRPTVIAPPVAVDDTSTGPFGTPQTENVMMDDSSNTGVALQRSLLRLIDPVSGEPVLTVTTEDGTFTANSNGTITFVPADGFVGTADPVVYQITDSLGQTDTASYTPTVEEPLESEANPDTTTGYLAAPQTVDLLDNDIADPVIGFNEESVRLCDVTASPAEVAPNCTSLSVTIPGVGNYTLTEAGLLTFTPEPDYLGTPDPLPYIVVDNFDVLVSSTYTPTVLMPPPPTAVPDRSVGPFNQSQFSNVVANDSPGTGTELDAEHLLMYNPETDTWGTDPVVTLDGVYTIEPASGVRIASARMGGAAMHGPLFTVAVDPSFIGNLHKIVFTPVPGFVGTAEAVEYQIADIHGQTAETTYTPTIETETLAETGSELLSGFWPVIPMIAIGALLMIATRRRVSAQ